MEIGNALGTFYEVDKSYCDSGYMGMARILVELDLKGSLADSMIIRRKSEIIHQSIDYEGIPFRCARCYVYGHLVAKCLLPNRRKIWVQEEQQGDFKEGLIGGSQTPRVAIASKYNSTNVA